MPPPEALGLDLPKQPSAVAATVDWNVTRARLNQLGGTSFRVDALGSQGYRFTILLRTSQPGRLHEIETTAATEAVAVAVALEQVESWAGRK